MKNNPILIVEDSDADAIWLKRQLTMAKLCNPCHTVTNAEEAIAYLKGTGEYSDRDKYPFPRVIFLDMRLPGLSGFDFLQAIKGIAGLEKTLIITLTGLEDLRSIRRAYELGASSFLTKPCRLADVENLIHGFAGYWDRPEENV